MNDVVQAMELECPNCRRAFASGRSARCPTCVVPLIYRTSDGVSGHIAGAVYRPETPADYLRWFAHANHLNKLWIAATLFYAATHLAILRGANLFWFAVFLLPPIAAFAVVCAKRSTSKSRRLAWGYLAAIVIGDVIAPFPQILPGMNLFNQLPLAESRLLTWQMALNCVYLFLVLPPAYLSGRLGSAVHRGRVGIGVFVLLFGYSIWIVLLPGVLLAILFGLLLG